MKNKYTIKMVDLSALSILELDIYHDTLDEIHQDEAISLNDRNIVQKAVFTEIKRRTFDLFFNTAEYHTPKYGGKS